MSIPSITHIVSLLENGRASEALPLLEDLVAQVPAHVSARVLLARVLDNHSELDRALTQWQWAAYYCPDNAVVEKGLQKAVLRKLMGAGIAPGAGMAPAASATPAKETVAPTEGPAPTSPIASELADLVAASTPVQPPVSDGPVLEYQDLDRLIQDLESAKIVPDPDIQMIPQTELETEIEDVVSETLARIYANQKFYEEAAIVYEKLAVQKPEKAEDFLQKAGDLRLKNVSKSSK